MAAHEVIHTTDYAEKTAGQSMLEVNDLQELMNIVSKLCKQAQGWVRVASGSADKNPRLVAFPRATRCQETGTQAQRRAAAAGPRCSRL